METLLKSLDLEKSIGTVTLSDGQTLPVPKITVSKLIKIVKFIGVDGVALWNEIEDAMRDETLDDLTQISAILDVLTEEQLIRIFSILLDLSDKEALSLDINEMLDVILVYVEKTNITKTFSQVRQLYRKMFNKELPDIKNLLSKTNQKPVGKELSGI